MLHHFNPINFSLTQGNKETQGSKRVILSESSAVGLSTGSLSANPPFHLFAENLFPRREKKSRYPNG